MIRRPPRSTRKESSAASDVYKRQQLVEALKKHKISSWKTKNNESTLIIELDILLDEKYEHIAALNVVEELEKKELRK